ncbi:unnamed protein product [Malus baccata var. baccata]
MAHESLTAKNPLTIFSKGLAKVLNSRGEIGKWIALVGVVLQLFFPKRFPVVAPSLFADTLRGDWNGAVICLLIAGYLLQEHIRAAGGFRDAFTKVGGISNTVGIIILFVYPVWAIVLYIL